MNRYVKLNFSSTLECPVLILICENEKLMSNTKLNATDEQVLKVICHSTATSWIPDPTDFIKSCSSLYLTTSIVPTGNVHLVHMHGDSYIDNKLFICFIRARILS